MNEESRPGRRLPDDRNAAGNPSGNGGLPRSSWTAKTLMRHVFPGAEVRSARGHRRGPEPACRRPEAREIVVCSERRGSGRLWRGSTGQDQRRNEGEALYLALEDPPRRLQRRLQLTLGGEPAPDGLFIETAWDKLLEGGRDRLDGWLAAHPACRMVVVDVFAKVRGIVEGNVNRYEADYDAMANLKTIADKHGVAILVVHHTRKAVADDFVDSVSGTHGLAGAADAVLVLSRSRGSADAKLHVTGRDIEEADYAMQFNPANGAWSLLEGPAEEYEVSDSRRRILVHLRKNGPRSPKRLSDKLDLDHDAVRQMVSRMARDEQIATDGGGLSTTCHSSHSCHTQRKAA